MHRYWEFITLITGEIKKKNGNKWERDNGGVEGRGLLRCKMSTFELLGYHKPQILNINHIEGPPVIKWEGEVAVITK